MISMSKHIILDIRSGNTSLLKNIILKNNFKLRIFCDEDEKKIQFMLYCLVLKVTQM
jgi:hypothetical protein